MIRSSRGTSDPAGDSGERAAGRMVVVISVGGLLLIAAGLRAPITSVGPVLQRIGADTGLSTSALGLLAALPPLAFAAVSPFPHLVARRLGLDRTLLLALLLLITGISVRSLPVPGLLWVGSLLLGGAIAVGNVLTPAVVKRDFEHAMSPMTGAYTTTMNTFAAIASGVAVPLAGWLVGGWRGAIGCWALLVVIAAAVWLVRMRVVQHPVAVPDPIADTGAAVAGRGSLLRSALAWQVTLYMGLQSTVFYTLMNFLPSIEAGYGISEAVAGGHLFGFMAAGIVAALAATLLLGRRRRQSGISVIVNLPIFVGLAGMLLWPEWMAVWAVLAGLTTGSSIVVALAFIGLRSRTADDTARLSGMAQSIGYLLAAGGPVAAGTLNTLTGSWWPVVGMLIVVSLAQTVIGVLAGRDRHV